MLLLTRPLRRSIGDDFWFTSNQPRPVDLNLLKMDLKRLDDYGLTVLVVFIIIFFLYEITNSIIIIYCFSNLNQCVH